MNMERYLKISNDTLTILKNYASINNGIAIKAGNVIKTMPENQGATNFISKAIVDEEFPKDFAIYDLNRFLSLVSLIEDPEFTFEDAQIVIEGKNNRIQYRYCSPLTITSPKYDSEFKGGEPDIQFHLSSENIKAINKGISFLKQEHLAFEGKDNTVYLRTYDKKNKEADSFKIDLEVDNSENFNMIFTASNIRFIIQDYKVKLYKKGIAEFVGQDIFYWIGCDESSTFE